MREVVVVGAVRSPIGRRNGTLSGIHPVDLSADVLTALLDRTGLDPALVEDVIWGCVGQVGDQAGNIGRNVVLAAGWPEHVPGTTIERQCGSSQQAIHFAAAVVGSGQTDIVVAGGVESMSRIPMGSARRAGPGDPNSERIQTRYNGVQFHQGLSAEMLAKKYRLSRQWLDEFSIESHERAARAAAAGSFDAELVPISLPGGITFSKDEGIRPGSTVEKLATLKPAFDPEGTVTAANSSQISDGSAAVLVMSGEKAKALGLKPLARVRTATIVGSDPILMLDGPIRATEKALKTAGLTLGDIGAFEVNEAFASVVGAWLKETNADPALVNAHGGAIAIGHPLGGSGARLATTLIHRMSRDGIRYGLQTMCEGGGMANATIYENCAAVA